MGGLAVVILEALEEGCEIYPCAEGKVFSSNGSIGSGIAKVHFLSSHGSRDVDYFRYVVLVNAHVMCLLRLERGPTTGEDRYVNQGHHGQAVTNILDK